MQTCCMISVEERTDCRPNLCANATSADGGGGWRDAHTEGEKYLGGEPSTGCLKSDSFGGNFSMLAMDKEDSLDVVDISLF